jgi:NSS family neurotransmitter:Na+ symporter
MVSGLFIAIAVMKFGAGRFRELLINTPEERRPVGRWFVFVMKYVIPVEFLALMIWWFYKMVTEFDPDGWWHPLHTYSVGTTLMQWGLLLVFLLLVNRWWAARVGAKEGE